MLTVSVLAYLLLMVISATMAMGILTATIVMGILTATIIMGILTAITPTRGIMLTGIDTPTDTFTDLHIRTGLTAAGIGGGKRRSPGRCREWV